MKPSLLILSAALLLIPCTAGAKAFAADHSRWSRGQYERYSRLGSERLIRLGEEFLYSREQPDSAFLCYTIAAERYRPGMSEAQTSLCLEGYYGRWMCRLINYSDIPAAMQDLAAAQEIIEHTSLPRHKLDLYYGQCYMSAHIATGFKPQPMSKAVDAFRRSAETALRQRDWRTFHSAFNNLVTAALLCDSARVLVPLVRRLGTLQEPQPVLRDVSLLWYRGASAMHARCFGPAIASYDSLVRMVPGDFEHARLRAGALLQKGIALMNLRRPAEAYAMADSLTALSHRFRLPDIRMTSYMLRSHIARSEGRLDQARRYRVSYLELKDSLSAERQAADFQEITSATRRRAMQRDIDAAEYRSRLRGNTLVFSGIIVVLLLAFVAYLFRSNRRIRRRSEMLYRQLQATVTSPDWIERNEELGVRNEELQQPAAEDVGTHGSCVRTEAETETEEKRTHEPCVPTALKYAGSGLGDEASSDLAERVKEFLLTSEAVYSPDFSLAVLGEALSTNRQYLSQCVNQQFGCNFATLVNRVRIRRAMLMLDDEATYGNYSIEGIAESVGFRTRGSFNTWFRRFTDLSAAEYRRLGKSLRPRLG